MLAGLIGPDSDVAASRLVTECRSVVVPRTGQFFASGGKNGSHQYSSTSIYKLSKFVKK